MARSRSQTVKLIDLARKMGIIRVRDLKEHRIHPEHLRRLCKRGILVRRGRGLYMLADAEVTIHHSLAEAAKWVPKGVVCLLSALSFHEIGTQNPAEIWMALDRRAGRPRTAIPALRVVYFSHPALTEGVEVHQIENMKVKIFCPAKTVADCFKYRNKIGIDVAMESLRECLRERKATMDELWHFAKVCRVSNIMKPYLESLA